MGSAADDELLAAATVAKSSRQHFAVGDLVKVTDGDLKNLMGKVHSVSVDGNMVTIMPKHDMLKEPLSFQAEPPTLTLTLPPTLTPTLTLTLTLTPTLTLTLALALALTLALTLTLALALALTLARALTLTLTQTPTPNPKPLSVQAELLVKWFKMGDHIKIVGGTRHVGETGMVVKVGTGADDEAEGSEKQKAKRGLNSATMLTIFRCTPPANPNPSPNPEPRPPNPEPRTRTPNPEPRTLAQPEP